jgi:2-oxoglutarate dehydrogenase E2 component (dihydrolipoamide succinyltransferase)
MAIEVKVPVLPESVSDATIADWHKQAGDAVSRDENLVDLETDKVVLEVPSPVDGVLKEIKFESGDTVNSEQVIALIEEGASTDDGGNKGQDKKEDKAEDKQSGAGKDAKADKSGKKSQGKDKDADKSESSGANEDLSPAGRRVASEKNIDASKVEGTGRGGRVTKEDLVKHDKSGGKSASPAPAPAAGSRPEERVPMTRIRKRIAERLMQSKDSIAMLTSFNEVNLAKVKQMRKDFGEQFKAEHDVKLGFMSFFVKAVCEALKRRPVVNASVDGDDIIYHGYQDISIAVSTDKGLVTPVLRDAQDMSFAEIEQAIGDYATKARNGKLSLDDLQGGTFTVTNGGTFGSLLSTPIVNPPQSAILGMHTIKERAIVENGQIIAAPMMYIALSYDHRIIDGKDAVLFLVDIKNQLENPQRMLLGL